MDVKEKILSLEGKIALVVPKKDGENSFLANVERVDKMTNTAILDIIGPPGENGQEHWPIDKIKDIVLIEEEK